MSDKTSIMDSNAFAMGLRCGEVVPVKSRVDDSLHQVERSVYEERCAECFHIATFELSGMIVALAVEFSVLVGNRFQGNTPDERVTNERQTRECRKQESFRVWSPFDELATWSEKPRKRSEI